MTLSLLRTPSLRGQSATSLSWAHFSEKSPFLLTFQKHRISFGRVQKTRVQHVHGARETYARAEKDIQVDAITGVTETGRAFDQFLNNGIQTSYEIADQLTREGKER